MGLNIHQKIIEIRKNINGFSKDTKGFGYDYVSGNQILRAIKDKMDELGVLLVPSVDYETLMWEKHQYQNKKGEEKLDFIIQAKMTYKWINAEDPNDFIEVPWLMIGQQCDDISKAAGTALTYNERYFLLKQFGLPTDEDDADRKEPVYGGKTAVKTSEKDKTSAITDAMAKRIYAIGYSKGYEPSKIQDMVKQKYHCFVKNLTVEQYEYIISKLEEK